MGTVSNGENERGAATTVSSRRRAPWTTVLLAASLCSSDHARHADALMSLPGRRLLLGRRAAASSPTCLELGRFPRRDGRDDSDVVTSSSPAYASPLFASPSHRARRRRGDGRRFVVAQHRKKLFRREAGFRLAYKDRDDDDDGDVLYGELLDIIDSRQRLMTTRPPMFRRFSRRKSLSKALFPTVVEGNYAEQEGLVTYELLDGIQDGAINNNADAEEEEEEAMELPPVRPNGVGKIIRKKKKKRNQVVVSNIHELHHAILDRGLELRDVDLNYSPPPSLLSSKRWSRESDGVVEDPMAPDQEEALRVLMANAHNRETLPLDSVSPQIELENGKEPNAEEWQLIGNVLAEDLPFTAEGEAPSAEPQQPFSHDVLNLLRRRYATGSTPGSRSPDDAATLALSIEGGGMRGAVSGGMAAAIACLGLSNAFDTVYGSSAGSIIGSYFVSRQLYLDVYTDILTAGKDLFVSKSKIFGDIFRNMFHVMKQGSPLGKRLNANVLERWSTSAAAAGANATSTMETLPPTRAGGLNISFVLDGIMCPERGLRPLDMEAFAHNDAVQPLRIVSSSVELETGKMKSICFGSKEGHFRDEFGSPGAVADDVSSLTAGGGPLYPEVESAKADADGIRRGLWACLGASMLVPGAADSPYRMHLPSGDDADAALTPHLCFDAFCYEPVPFRAAVAEGATHVLALRSRPAGFEPKTKPTLYERAVAPLYFRSNGVPNTVAKFFEKGGQQYLYAEDVLICDQGLNATEPVPIPPAKVLYGGPEATSDTDREKWARAHLLPITVPADVPELSTLAQDRDDILEGMRSGFASAYDALAPVVGLEAGPDSLDGMQVAKLVFPDADPPQESVLEKQFPLAGEKLGGTRAVAKEDTNSARARVKEAVVDAGLTPAPRHKARLRRLLSLRRALRFTKRVNESAKADATTPVATSPPTQDADELFSFLPGVQLGTLPMVAERLQTYLENHSYLKSA